MNEDSSPLAEPIKRELPPWAQRVAEVTEIPKQCYEFTVEDYIAVMREVKHVELSRSTAQRALDKMVKLKEFGKRNSGQWCVYWEVTSEHPLKIEDQA